MSYSPGRLYRSDSIKKIKESLQTVEIIAQNRSKLLLKSLNHLHLHNKKQIENLTIYNRIKYSWNNGNLSSSLLWIIWLFIGSTFYTFVDFNGDFSKGFYFAVNVGYSIGFGILPEKKQISYYFSTIYILIGATAISASLALLIESNLESKTSLQEHIDQQKQLKSSIKLNIFDRLLAIHQTRSVFLMEIWLIWIIFGSVWSC